MGGKERKDVRPHLQIVAISTKNGVQTKWTDLIDGLKILFHSFVLCFNVDIIVSFIWYMVGIAKKANAGLRPALCDDM